MSDETASHVRYIDKTRAYYQAEGYGKSYEFTGPYGHPSTFPNTTPFYGPQDFQFFGQNPGGMQPAPAAAPVAQPASNQISYQGQGYSPYQPVSYVPYQNSYYPASYSNYPSYYGTAPSYWYGR